MLASPLMDGKQYAADVEDAFREMWKPGVAPIRSPLRRGGGVNSMTPITIDQAMQIAIEHHQAGRLAEAEAHYRQVLGQHARSR